MKVKMARHDWYRNTNWNSDIESAFFTKLARAKHKFQYLRIQASILAESHPQIALRPLDQYFGLGANFDRALAHVHRATAHLSLGELERAVEEYETALAVEASHPNFGTRAVFELPLLIAERRIEARYARALELLQRCRPKILFHVDHFCWNAAQALINRAVGKPVEAREYARAALEAASHGNSGMRYHPTVGIVGDRYDPIRRELARMVESSAVRKMFESMRSFLARRRRLT
jgi:tetratricopeptide (TPR) repeat protein